MYHSLIFNVEANTHVRNAGAYRIAHWLRAQDWDVEVIDYTLLWSFEQLVELAKSRITKQTKFIGFSFQFSVWNELLDQFAIWLNTEYPDVILISGANHFPPPDIMVDYHIYGFGERALDHLLLYLFSNGPKPEMMTHGNMQLIDASKYPAYPLTDYSVQYEERDFLQPWEFLCIETGRGCIFKCTFCNFTILGVKEDHSTSAESFERQLKDNYYRWGIKNYIISEETFNDRTDKIAKYAKVVNDLDFTPWFAGFIRLDLLLSRRDDKKLLEDMHVLGHYYGIESLHHPTAKAFKKGLHPDKVKEGLLNIKQYYAHTGRYRGTISFILGGPHEPVESMYQSLNWVENNYTDNAIAFFPLVIPIGKNRRPSELTDNYEKYGYKPVPLEELKRRHPDEGKTFDHLASKMKYEDDERLLWENEYVDIIEAWKIYRDWFASRNKYGFKLTNFTLGKYTGKDHTIEDKLKLKFTQLNDAQKEEFEWYYSYIEKKLNWLPKIIV